jgi:hypothetical protein
VTSFDGSPFGASAKSEFTRTKDEGAVLFRRAITYPLAPLSGK